MKKKVTIEQVFCDFCGKPAGHVKCISCGKDFCYDCLDLNAVEYKHSVYFSGSGDGTYCLTCNEEKLMNGDPLHRAYRKIQSLRNELTGFQEDF